MSGYLLKRAVRRPPHEARRYYASFPIRRRAGASRAASWPRSNGTLASFTRASLDRDQSGAAGFLPLIRINAPELAA